MAKVNGAVRRERLVDEEQKRLIETGILVSEEFDGASPGYMSADSLSLEYIAGEQYLLSVTLVKKIDKEAADKIIAARRGVKND